MVKNFVFFSFLYLDLVPTGNISPMCFSKGFTYKLNAQRNRNSISIAEIFQIFREIRTVKITREYKRFNLPRKDPTISRKIFYKSLTKIVCMADRFEFQRDVGNYRKLRDFAVRM